MIGTPTYGQSTADDLTIATSASTGITIRSGTGSDGNIYFSDGTSGSDQFRGYVQYGHSTNEMVFGTNAIERLRIHNDGDITITATGDPHLKVTGPGQAQLTLTSTSGTDHCSINFGDSSDHDAGEIRYTNSDDSLNFDTSGVERMTLDSSGNLTISSGNLTIPYRLIHNGDTDTYMEFPAANRIRFATANQNRLQIREDGRIVTHGYDGDRFIFNHDMGHGARNVQIYAVSDASTWHSFVGTNLTHDGTNYIKPSDDGNQNWGNISGIVFEGANSVNGTAMRFVVDQPGNNGLNYSLGSGNSGKTAAIDNKTVAQFSGGGHFYPGANNTYDLGLSGTRWRNLYVNDLQLSNEAKKDEGGNDVDGTWGDWTLQEGEHKIYMINNRTGKKYSLKMEEE